MPTTQAQCPNCKQPITADVQQLFDVSANADDKNRLLGGAVNVLRCPHCGYQGGLTTPVVYHDASKELLLTFFPPELYSAAQVRQAKCRAAVAAVYRPEQ